MSGAMPGNSNASTSKLDILDITLLNLKIFNESFKFNRSLVLNDSHTPNYLGRADNPGCFYQHKPGGNSLKLLLIVPSSTLYLNSLQCAIPARLHKYN
jgi:hypothetical protein